MNIYDRAHELAHELKNSEEFNEYKVLYKEVMANEENKKMIDDFREKVMKFQLDQIGQEKPDPEELEKLQQLQSVLMANSQVNRFMMAEMKFSQIFEDVNKIIAESIQLD